MDRLQNGSAWQGWAIFCGAPAAVAAFAIHPGLAVLIGVAAFVAWRHGSELEAEADLILLAERARRANERREQALAAEWDSWDAAWEAIDRDFAAGLITAAEHDARIDALLDVTPGDE